MDVQKIIELVGSALLGGGGLLAIQQYFFNKKKEKIKNYKEFLIELETMHEKLMESNEKIMKLSVQNEQLMQQNRNQQALIQDLTTRIDELVKTVTEQKKLNHSTHTT